MKKLSILIALILCVTVGSVYATWFYAETTMETNVHKFTNLSLSDVNTSARTGQISVLDTMILKIDDNNGDHTPGWDTDVAGEAAGAVTVTFLPNTGAADTTFKYTITVENNLYDPDNDGQGTPFFTYDPVEDEEANVVLTDTFTYTAGAANAVKVISLSDITSVLRVNAANTLPTYEDYQAYQTDLANVAINLTVEEVTN